VLVYEKSHEAGRVGSCETRPSLLESDKLLQDSDLTGDDLVVQKKKQSFS
jgi:hypothetical protein